MAALVPQEPGLLKCQRRQRGQSFLAAAAYSAVYFGFEGERVVFCCFKIDANARIGEVPGISSIGPGAGRRAHARRLSSVQFVLGAVADGAAESKGTFSGTA